MSSPSFDIKTGEIQIAADEKFLSTQALYEALESELVGYVWQITSRKTLPEAVLIGYKALPKHQWAYIQEHIAPQDWPILPQQLKHRRDLRARHRVELVVMLISSVLFALLIWGGSMSYISNQSYADGLKTLLQGRAQRQSALNAAPMPQREWIVALNTLTQGLSRAGVGVDSFDVDSDGGQIALDQTNIAQQDLSGLLARILPEMEFSYRGEGRYQWSW